MKIKQQADEFAALVPEIMAEFPSLIFDFNQIEGEGSCGELILDYINSVPGKVDVLVVGRSDSKNVFEK